ncbi:MAG: hypothetical protein ABIQ95_02150 [Bdellovibrionia bacterium]
MKSNGFYSYARFGIVGALLLIGPTVFAESNAGQRPVTEVKVRDLNKHPGRFAGGKVMVTGKVSSIEGPGAFIIEGTGFLNNKILAVVEGNQRRGSSGEQAGSTAPVIKEKQKLQLTGRVEEIGVTKIERTYSPLKAEIKAEFEGNMPVLVVPPNGIKDVS